MPGYCCCSAAAHPPSKAFWFAISPSTDAPLYLCRAFLAPLASTYIPTVYTAVVVVPTEQHRSRCVSHAARFSICAGKAVHALAVSFGQRPRRAP